MASGAVSAANMMISEIPRLRVFCKNKHSAFGAHLRCEVDVQLLRWHLSSIVCSGMLAEQCPGSLEYCGLLVEALLHGLRSTYRAASATGQAAELFCSSAIFGIGNISERLRFVGEADRVHCEIARPVCRRLILRSCSKLDSRKFVEESNYYFLEAVPL